MMTISLRNVMRTAVCFFILLIVATGYNLQAGKIYLAPWGNNATGDGTYQYPYMTLSETGKHAGPGDTIVARGGVYPQEQQYIGYSYVFRGAPGSYLVVMGDPDDIAAGNKAIFDADVGDGHHASAVSMTACYSSPSRADYDLAYIKLLNLVFRNGHTMGLNIDDGGTWSRENPAHHITIEGCEFYDCDPTHTQGSGLKLAGVDTFVVRNCTFKRCGHNGIDMVGCHEGLVTQCVFMDNLAVDGDDGLGVQCKGGSRNVVIERNIFKDLYMYGVSLGQASGLAFFRPPPGELDGDGQIIDYEAKNCNAYRNIFINVGYPVVFSRSRNCKAYQNTIYIPISNADRARGVGGTAFVVFFRHDPWPDMIGTVPVTHVRSADVKNNIFYFGTPYGNRPVTFATASPAWTDEPETIVMSNNLWYCHDNVSESLPDWDFMENNQWGAPVHSGNIVGDPYFINANPAWNTDFELSEGTPAMWMGLILEEISKDYFDRDYNVPPTIGALELYVNSSAPAAPTSVMIWPK